VCSSDLLPGTKADTHPVKVYAEVFGRVFRVTTAPFTYEGQPLVLLALEDVSELVALRGLLPICANCKKIRDEENYWQDVEAYLQKHLNVEFTHGLCPACVKKLYPTLCPAES